MHRRDVSDGLQAALGWAVHVCVPCARALACVLAEGLGGRVERGGFEASCVATAASARTSAAMPSTRGGVRGSTQGSWRPLASRTTSSPPKVAVLWARPMVETGLTATRK